MPRGIDLRVRGTALALLTAVLWLAAGCSGADTEVQQRATVTSTATSEATESASAPVPAPLSPEQVRSGGLADLVEELQEWSG